MLNMCLPLLHFRKRKLNQVESNIIVCGAVHLCLCFLCLWKPSDLRTNTVFNHKECYTFALGGSPVCIHGLHSYMYFSTCCVTTGPLPEACGG